MTFVTNLAEVLPEILLESIVSRQVFMAEQVRVLLGRLSEICAGLMFAWHIWPRIVGREG